MKGGHGAVVDVGVDGLGRNRGVGVGSSGRARVAQSDGFRRGNGLSTDDGLSLGRGRRPPPQLCID